MSASKSQNLNLQANVQEARGLALRLEEAIEVLKELQAKPKTLGAIMYHTYTKPRLERDPEFRKKYMEYHIKYSKEHYDKETRKEWRDKHKDRLNAERRAKRVAMSEEELKIEREKCRLRSAARRERERLKRDAVAQQVIA